MKRQLSSTRRMLGEHGSWPKSVLKKWFNLKRKEYNLRADENNSDFDEEDEDEEEQDDKSEEIPCKLKRSNSETLRSQYIEGKDIRICVGTWNVGGKVPHDDLDIEEWLDTFEPADIYVLGIQEVVPLNAGNIFGAEGSSPVPRWENLIREALNKVRMTKPIYKCYSDHPSPSKFWPFDDGPSMMEELQLHETDSEGDDERAHPFSESQNEIVVFNTISGEKRLLPKRLDRCHGFGLIDSDAIPETPNTQQKKLTRTFSSSERIGLAWPEQPLDLLAECVSDSLNPFRSKSFETCSSFKSGFEDHKDSFNFGIISEFDLVQALRRKKKSYFVRIISKKMVGIFISIWARRTLRKHMHNLKVSAVGVGAMGFIGNKGSISVSMSIYQTQFCFICAHLSSGEKIGDELRRNADVKEIYRRTRFLGLPKTIKDHERIFWFGDLNYRINLTYGRTHELISAKKWVELFEKDQIKQELKKCGTFDGWKEGIINFPPTYKYVFNSEKYIKEDSKTGRRTPAWCDRILAFGKGVKLLSYRRSELKVSDHRPVTATFSAEVEVFSHRKLQKALSITDAEVDEGKFLEDLDAVLGMGTPYTRRGDFSMGDLKSS